MRACQAGLDVYCEKPLSLTVAEGRKLVVAVRRHRRVLQVGSQQRSMEMDRFACQFVRAGGLGRISYVELQNWPGPLRDGDLPAEPMPDGMAWDLFCGPTPSRPYNWRLWQKDERNWQGRRWRGWDIWRTYSGHLLTNWGAHAVDLAQWALGMDHAGPVEFEPLTEGYQGEMRLCPVVARYANGVELRMVHPKGFGGGGMFYGERGRMLITRNEFQADPADLVTDPPDPSLAEIWKGTGIVARPHIQNWLDCIKTRGTPNAPVEVGHRTATICHVAGIARELGRKLRWDAAKEAFADDAEASALLDRLRRPGWELPDTG
jgi:predicted dehydrogenase